MTEVVLLTGAAGLIGSALRTRMARPGRLLRLFDTATLGAPGPDEQVIQASVTDPAAVTDACAGVDAIVHLAGISGEAPYDEIQAVNVEGTRNVFEGAREHGISRVLLASSNHAVGFARREDEPLPADVPFAPDTWYGWSKTSMESMGQLYHHRFGMDVVALRIGTCRETPPHVRSLATWLSLDDAARLVEASLSTPSPGFRQVWGVSANTRNWWSLAEGFAIGYAPEDDAEAYADQVDGEPTDLVGGPFTTIPLGER
ncbi:NAD-dependent epimerase/dehydratase family protein [Cryptosporangium phraense]|uniref:NAD(P)-dependent oxidoreductase n=1 Tax=Cryptosporangium phraense TaxID=2593070 RepID=A0A545APB3_9ACTN|nr:NAD(P)-dependent oxidoreductase [Cryptosporangium phraense]TQS43169.1 NAD(P)-dependent oxidoreductase [Cryptosporangium phraense]